jgi:hypothetical protein
MVLIIFFTGIPCADAAGDGFTAQATSFRLVRAVMCESIENYEPKSIAVAFSINIGRISCYSAFEGVAETTHVQHKWYRRDELVTAKRLTLKPPSWATYSSVQLREDDKGPWRVEIWDSQEQLVKTLRFSVVD